MGHLMDSPIQDTSPCCSDPRILQLQEGCSNQDTNSSKRSLVCKARDPCLSPCPAPYLKTLFYVHCWRCRHRRRSNGYRSSELGGALLWKLCLYLEKCGESIRKADVGSIFTYLQREWKFAHFEELKKKNHPINLNKTIVLCGDNDSNRPNRYLHRHVKSLKSHRWNLDCRYRYVYLFNW